jgi:cytochrome P450
MTIDISASCLPTIDFEHARTPEEAHELIRHASRQGPIAIGPHGPEALAHDLVRTVLRDDRFAIPQGLHLAAQGVTSGELWDKVITGLLSLNGEAHHRQRRIVSRAFTPRAAERLRTTCTNIINELTNQDVAHGSCDLVTDIARQYPIPVICALLGTPSEDWQLFSGWADEVFKLFDWNIVRTDPTFCARGRNSRPTSTTWSRNGAKHRPMTCCPT